MGRVQLVIRVGQEVLGDVVGQVPEVSATVYEAAGWVERVRAVPEYGWEGLPLVEEWISLFGD